MNQPQPFVPSVEPQPAPVMPPQMPTTPPKAPSALPKIIGGLLIVAVLAGAGWYFLRTSVISPEPTPTTSSSLIESITPSVSPTTSPQARIYENQYMKVSIPAGWSTTEGTHTIFYENCTENKANCTTTPVVEAVPSAINIMKDDYILYINTRAEQASGIVGGRFNEIAAGAPSVDAIITDPGQGPCGVSDGIWGITKWYSRLNFYVSNQNKQTWCTAPTNGSTAWYFSYVTDGDRGYFINSNGPGVGLVITMAYNSKDPNKLPIKGSPALDAMLAEMSNIVATLQVKSQ